MATIANVSNPLQIPVVDISGPDAEESIADQLVNAATVHGFVYIKNLGRDIPIKDIEHAFDLVGLVHLYELCVCAKLYCQSKKFFASPIEEKQKVAITESVGIRPIISKFPSLQLRNIEPWMGCYAQRNIGFKNPKGNYIPLLTFNTLSNGPSLR